MILSGKSLNITGTCNLCSYLYSFLKYKNKLSSITKFLSALGIPYKPLSGSFTSGYKMIEYLKVFRNFSEWGPKDYIYHTDLDEIVTNGKEYKYALKELRRGKCDAVKGMWRDRISRDGSLSNITIGEVSLNQQFPLRCRVSKHFMPALYTSKVVIYRANLRLTPGQHMLWGDVDVKDERGKWNYTKALQMQLDSRKEKNISESTITRLLPPLLNKRPVTCRFI